MHPKSLFIITTFIILTSCSRGGYSNISNSNKLEDTQFDCLQTGITQSGFFFTGSDGEIYFKDNEGIISKKSELRISKESYPTSSPPIAEGIYKGNEVSLCEIYVFPKKGDDLNLELFILQNGWTIRSKGGFGWQVFIGNSDLNLAISQVNSSSYATATLITKLN